jgi:hypothetical protein
MLKQAMMSIPKSNRALKRRGSDIDIDGKAKQPHAAI